MFIYKWKAANGIEGATEFLISVNAQSSRNKWLGIGLSTDEQMGDDDVVVCKTTNQVSHYRTIGHVEPVLLNPFEPAIGLSNMKIESDRGWLICSFTRLNKLENEPNYFDLNNNYHVLAAYGNLGFQW